MFGLLAVGGTVVIPSASASPDPAEWLDTLHQAQITLWDSAPPLMQMLVDYATARNLNLPDSLRLVLLSGDWIPLTLPDRIHTLGSPQTAVISLGGATEASIWSILYPIAQVEPHWKSIPYGRPMTRQQFHILNEDLEPCQNGEAGQLYIGGIGLARCYWRDPEKPRSLYHPSPNWRSPLLYGRPGALSSRWQY
ncbi:AMP-binding protein [Geitlerinema calcuttense]|uniref:AMP-binding protein n=1 Tax=Geitlerinema calcuttense TaxID=1471433 RepID=UPI0032E7F8BF